METQILEGSFLNYSIFWRYPQSSLSSSSFSVIKKEIFKFIEIRKEMIFNFDKKAQKMTLLFINENNRGQKGVLVNLLLSKPHLN